MFEEFYGKTGLDTRGDHAVETSHPEGDPAGNTETKEAPRDDMAPYGDVPHVVYEDGKVLIVGDMLLFNKKKLVDSIQKVFISLKDDSAKCQAFLLAMCKAFSLPTSIVSSKENYGAAVDAISDCVGEVVDTATDDDFLDDVTDEI